MEKKNVEELGKKCFTILNFIEKRAPLQMEPVMKQFKVTLEHCVVNQNKKQLSSFHRDLVEWANGLSETDFQVLNTEYYTLYKDNVNENHEKLIGKIFKKGKIVNEKEHQALLFFVDQSYDKKDMNEKVEQANSIISSYENLKRK